MIYPNWNKEFFLYTNASHLDLSAVLVQNTEHGEKVIEYAFRNCTNSEKNYGISQLEKAAVIWAIKKFKLYLHNNRFNLITDHKALVKLKEIKDNNSMLYR